jgi:hypothetical protein
VTGPVTTRLAAAITEPRVVVRPGGAVLLLAAMTGAERYWAQHGAVPPAGWSELYGTLAAVAGSGSGTAVLPLRHGGGGSAPSPTSVVMVDPVNTSEAAEMLGCTARNVRGLCRRGAFESAGHRGSGWVMERVEVLARAAGHTGGTSPNPGRGAQHGAGTEAVRR